MGGSDKYLVYSLGRFFLNFYFFICLLVSSEFTLVLIAGLKTFSAVIAIFFGTAIELGKISDKTSNNLENGGLCFMRTAQPENLSLVDGSDNQWLQKEERRAIVGLDYVCLKNINGRGKRRRRNDEKKKTW